MDISTVSVRPSTIIGPRAAADCTSLRPGYPDWVLLNKTARISDQRNATTALCRTREGQAVAVSFWLVDPPAVSYFSVHCPGLEDDDFSDTPPFLLCAEGAFVLFCVTLDDSVYHFVYSARGIPGGRPSLHRLPDPKPRVEAFMSQQFGLLPCGNEHYAVAFLHHQWESSDQAWHYYAYIFSSETKAWKRSKEALLYISKSDQLLFDRHASSKQITVRESALGWVDLLRGILLLSNLFDERPVITYIPLPKLKACITDRNGYPSYAPEFFCDITCCDDLIKFVEIKFDEPNCRANGKAWKATTWNRKVSWDDWGRCSTVDVAEISVDPSYLSLLPELLNDETKQLEIKNLYFLNPTLSVDDDDLLYMMGKVNEEDDTAWVVVVDMKRAALEALVPVSIQPSYTVTMYCPCTFPKYYLNITPDIGSPVEKDKSDKWPQGRPSPNNSGSVQRKRRRKKKQARAADCWLEQPYLLYFVGCVLIAIFVKVFFHLSGM
ncbi:hypothetical protein CFC21_039577 [Triticum aestivum]|uniref:DUF1618 domain-containing protein n=2 Tax=Triticum aestivum TaxID=4565 RepID=A0A9R1FGP2_WHEAT|nr:uncharacterized protein LOC123064682 [Triticum aestivum]KAF7027542.1 hypothetical protein CFC21_039577 [Triticum aestivum]